MSFVFTFVRGKDIICRGNVREFRKARTVATMIDPLIPLLHFLANFNILKFKI